jgi:hypothetical protein
MAKATKQPEKAPHSSNRAKPVDGGSAPAAYTGNKVSPVAGANNGGSPSAALLAAIAAQPREATTAVPSTGTSSAGIDGGAAPV